MIVSLGVVLLDNKEEEEEADPFNVAVKKTNPQFG